MNNELVASEAQTESKSYCSLSEFLADGVSLEEQIELAELFSAAEADD